MQNTLNPLNEINYQNPQNDPHENIKTHLNALKHPKWIKVRHLNYSWLVKVSYDAFGKVWLG